MTRATSNSQFPSVWNIIDALVELDGHNKTDKARKFVNSVRAGSFNATQVTQALNITANAHDPRLPVVSVRRSREWIQDGCAVPSLDGAA